MNKAQMAITTLFLGLFALALSAFPAFPAMALDLGKFQLQPPQECMSPDMRIVVADQAGFTEVERDADAGIAVWSGPNGLHLLDVQIDGLSCIVGYYVDEGGNI